MNRDDEIDIAPDSVECQPTPVKGSMTATRSIHRAPPAPLLSDNHLAVIGQIVGTIHGHGHDAFDRSACIEFMAQQVADLSDPTSPLVGQRLAAHMVVVEALMIRFAQCSSSTSSPDAASKYAKLALQAHASFLKTAEVLADLAARRPRDLVEPEGEEGGE